MWPNSYAGGAKHYDYEGGEPAAYPPAGYLWSNAVAAGLSVRNYGYLVNNRKMPVNDGMHVESIRDSTLSPSRIASTAASTSTITDVDRAKTFLEDLEEFEKQGTMPRLLMVRMGNDHTSGTAPGKISPLSAMADNDYALGIGGGGLVEEPFLAENRDLCAGG